jgi:hypothetical protein
MGFAWHKFIPRKALIQCPPPCDHTYETSIGNNEISTICPPKDPFDPFGVQPCAIFNPIEFQYGGAACGGKDVLKFTFKENPGGPIEMRLNTPLDCTAGNNVALNNASLTPCEMGTASISQQFYYYRTPNSPNSTPIHIASEKLCFKYNPFTVPDRMMVISARNRYKYGGWHVDPACPTAGAEGGPPLLWDPVTTPAGGTGIRQAEQLSLSRSWPLPNSVLNLPLFGANQASVSPPSSNPGKCGDGACDDGSCFTVQDNGGTGHFGVQTGGNGKGYYSFQCFNPMGFVGIPDANGVKPNTSFPTCSVWSLVQALWHQAWKCPDSQANYGETEAENQASNPAWTPFVNLLAADPSGLTNGGESNVTRHLALFGAGLTTIGFNLIMPNVFLWDKDAYTVAASNYDKWKHLYIVGNANVIFDTQCMVGSFDPNVDYPFQDMYGFVIHLDEVAHDPAYGTSGNARLLGFYGCDDSIVGSGNIGSKANFKITTMDCALADVNPKTGQVYTTYCDACANENNTGLQQVGFPGRCTHIGHVEDCNTNIQRLF